jgi:CheY-like chemotaxis protein
VPVLGPRVVILEREQSLQNLLQRYLPDTEIHPVTGFAAAHQALSASPAQALLVNLAPSEEISPDLLNSIPYGIPVIQCWLPGEFEAARRLGVVSYLVKPVTRERVLNTLDQLPSPVRSVLIVDDEPDELHLFARMLESAEEGYQVLQATSGKRAMSILRSRKPDAVLLDLVMPVMDGYHVLAEKAADDTIRDIPVIVISSRDPMGDIIIGNTFKVSHSGGFSSRNLLDFVQMVGSLMSKTN